MHLPGKKSMRSSIGTNGVNGAWNPAMEPKCTRNSLNGSRTPQTRLNNRLLVTCSREHQNLDMLKRLLSEGADPNYRVEWCNDGSPTLHQWALYAHVEAVQLLLDHGADINILDNLGRSALEYATGALNWSKTSKAEQVVILIIQAGADVNVKSTLGNTPLMWAARAGNLKITKLLIEKGANADDTDNV
jgi:ankyrin repeat protein